MPHPMNRDANTKANIRHAPPLLPKHYMAHSGGAHTRHHGARIPLCTSYLGDLSSVTTISYNVMAVVACCMHVSSEI